MANELGDYLPGDDESLEDESERIEAKNGRLADAECEKIAKQYGGFKSNAVAIGPKLFDCQLKVWRKKNG